MTLPFDDIIRYISDGERVDSGVTNRPIQDVARQVKSLKSLFELLSVGRCLTDTSANLDASTAVGMPVYLDASKIYRPAVVAEGAAWTGGQADPSMYVVGVVSAKASATLGEVTLYGPITLSTAEWAVPMGTFSAGHYYLSTVAGHITQVSSPLLVYIGYALPDGTFVVKPQPPQYGHHVHHSVSLSGAPAGTVTDPPFGTAHTITAPNPALRGWLPANSTYFPLENIPSGAVFGYNITHSAETALQSIFPLRRLGAATISQGGLLLDAASYEVTQSAIWWKSSDFGKAPWGIDYAATAEASPLTLWLDQNVASTSPVVVQSLTSASDSIVPIRIRRLGGGSAASGSLDIALTTLLSQGANTVANGTAVKQISGGTFATGPSIDSIEAGTGISVVTTAGVARIAAVNSSTVVNGLFTYGDSCTTVGIDGLAGAKMNPSQASSAYFTIDIPNGVAADPAVAAFVDIYSGLPTTLPALLVEARSRVPGTTGAWVTLATLSGSLPGMAVERFNLPVLSGEVGGSLDLRISRAADAVAVPVYITRVGGTIA